MAANPIEVLYQVGRTLFCVRSSLASGSTAQFYNTSTQLYETYNASNWLLYAIAIPEVSPGYYRVLPPTGSLSTPATEIIYEQRGASPATSDAPAIADGNSQGVNIGTVNGVQTSIGANPSAIVDICNLALGHLGQSKITTISDATEAARRCNQIFNNCRDEVLRCASWKFATAILSLVNLPNETVVGWNYVYTFPTDCVYARKVFIDNSNAFSIPIFTNITPVPTPTTNPEGIQFRVIYQQDLSLQVVVCNSNPAYMEYTARVVDPTLYDSLFIKALSFKLAAELAVLLNGDTTASDKMSQKFMLLQSEAQRQDGNESGVPNREKSNYVDVR